MNKRLLIYDLEIRNAIPPEDSIDRQEGISYCEGWEDFSGMGISAISWVMLNPDTLQPIEHYSSVWDFRSRAEIHRLITSRSFHIGGFNSSKFDDRLMKASGVDLRSDFDILDLVLRAAGVQNQAYWKQGLRYNLAWIAQANDLQKSGAGESAPILYQEYKIAELLSYCLNDSIVETEILIKLLKGTLIDPNTGLMLGPVGLEGLP